MDYQSILEALNGELVCVNRAIEFLAKAGGGSMASGGEPANQIGSELHAIEQSLRVGAHARAQRRVPVLDELREDRSLLMKAIESIHMLAERVTC